MAKREGKRLKLLKGEKTMVATLLVFFLFLVVLNVYTSSMVARTNIDVEELKTNIERQTEENESLSMQIDELASLDNIQEIAKEYGLSYNNTNILQVK